MKKQAFIFVVLIAIGIAIFLGFIGIKNAEAPVKEVPAGNNEETETSKEIDPVIAAAIEAKANLIQVNAPAVGATITSPVTITGIARGYWYFEASFPITIVNWDGLIIGEGYATAAESWMTEEFVPFSATVSYTLPENTPYTRGTIILKKDNPSGLPENDDALEIPIEFAHN